MRNGDNGRTDRVGVYVTKGWWEQDEEKRQASERERGGEDLRNEGRGQRGRCSRQE